VCWGACGPKLEAPAGHKLFNNTQQPSTSTTKKGDAAALAAELKRVTALLDTLTSTQPAARATKAAPPRDGSGEWLAQILELRDRRMAALAAEQARLRRRLAEVDAAAVGGAVGGPEAASRAEQPAQKGEL
jgi:hypothetical protein